MSRTSRTRRPPPEPIDLPIPAVFTLFVMLILCSFGSGVGLSALYAKAVQPAAPTVLPVLIVPLTPITSPTASPAASATPSPSPTLLPSPSPNPLVEKYLAELKPEDKIGQMLVTGISTTSADDEAIQLIAAYRVGGIWLTTRNIADGEQTKTLIDALNEAEKQSGPGVPLFISVDHEGGMVNRFPYDSGFTAFPSPMAVGATRNSDFAYLMALAQAKELRMLGFNMNLAPVLDVNTNPLNPVIGIRAFGADPASVAAFGLGYFEGERSAGMIGVAKHFPGHGSVATDSHIELPIVPDKLADLEAAALPPFRAAIDDGLPAIMVGHLKVPDLDPNLPASLSPLVINGYLRDRLGFGGVVFTDDINMKALTLSYDIGEAAVLAVEAGADVIMSSTPQSTIQVYEALSAAVQSGRLSSERIDKSLQRILDLKARSGLLDGSMPAFVPDTAANVALTANISAQSVTLLSDEAHPIPLLPASRLLVIIPCDELRVSCSGTDVVTPLGQALKQAGHEVQEVLYQARNDGPQTEARAAALANAAGYDIVIMGMWSASIDSVKSSAWQRLLVTDLMQQNSNLVLIALGVPYDLKMFPGAGAYLATYGAVPAQQQALAAALVGQQLPKGQLPVPDADVVPK